MVVDLYREMRVCCDAVAVVVVVVGAGVVGCVSMSWIFVDFSEYNNIFRIISDIPLSIFFFLKKELCFSSFNFQFLTF